MRRSMIRPMLSRTGRARHMAEHPEVGPYRSLCGWEMVIVIDDIRTALHSTATFHPDCRRCAELLIERAR